MSQIARAGKYLTRSGDIAMIAKQGWDNRWSGSIPGKFGKTWWHADGRHNLYVSDDIVKFEEVK